MWILGCTLLSFLAVSVSGAFVAERCPDGVNTFKPILLKEYTNVTLDRTSSSEGSLCTMVRFDQGNQLPVAKSYHGNPWERAGGGYAAGLDEWTCDTPDTCWNMLPKGVYLLQSRETTRPSKNGSTARFLETVSFGPTANDVEQFSGSFAEYVKKQIKVKPTYHRELFRRMAHPAWPFNKPGFATSLDPCAPDTAWRIHAFGVDDIGKTIDFKKVRDRWEIRVDGFVRSMPAQLRIINNSNFQVKEGSYKFCPGNPRRRMQRGEFPLMIDGRCRLLDPKDVEIAFPSNVKPPHMIDGNMTRLSNKMFWVETTTDNTARYYVRVEGMPQGRCSSLPKVLKEGRNEPVFGLTEIGEWVIHEPRAAVNENSLESPMLDGGRVAWANNQTRSCANVPRTVFNEKDCVLSNVLSCGAGSRDVSDSARDAVVCGSPGEVGTDVKLGETLIEIASIPGFTAKKVGLPADPQPGLLERQREFIWSHVALNAKDQLRQRVAFALMQIFALPKSSIGAAGRHTEIFLNYYDIFVRHAFGNYRDILLETTFNPLMAESLSFRNSGSLGLSFAKDGTLNFPDENFAREIMQLFTISLIETDRNGIPLLNAENKTIRTYDSDDIISMAKAWTGFQLQAPRTNIESADNRNRIDPMKLTPRLRDRFPKMGLGGEYIGDRYPLCCDLPKKVFMFKGAKYRLLGKRAEPELVTDSPSWSDSRKAKRLVIRPNGSGLYEQLCSAVNGSCTYPGLVKLPKRLRCSQSNEGECGDIDSIRVVKVDNMFYEYVPSVPCVNYAFFNDGMKAAGKFPGRPSVCANPMLPAASPACCDVNEQRATPACEYAGERVSFSLAQKRCKANGMTICAYERFDGTDQCPHEGSQWTDTPCQVEAKINSEGAVAIVHSTGNAVNDLVDENTPSFFRVTWPGGQFPTPQNQCGGGNCRVLNGQCLCIVSVRNEIVFDKPPVDKKPIVRALHTGFPEVDVSRFVKTVVKGTAPLNGYTYYSPDGSCCNENTIFEASDVSGRTFFLKNTKSLVDIDGAPRTYSFKNPVHFNSVDPNEYSVTEALWETEAVIDHLLYHKNTAPFVAHRLIQRFGISNPTPRFVGSVARAFRGGRITKGEATFGSSVYGCMEATIAAIVLDREFTQYGNHFDPASGSLREPILKVIAFMRAMGFKSSVPLVELDEMNLKIGQAPYEQPSVFSFFRFDYSPPGIAANSTLVAPEAEVMSAGRIVGILNGLFSLVDHGLVACDNGFGFTGCNDGAAGNLIDFSKISGDMTTMIDDWSLLLTGGRLSQKKKETIQRVLDGEADTETARRLAVKLITTSPEFHTTNMPDTLSLPESESVASNPGRGKYKAVIHLSLNGGCDSFNVLMPHETCADLHADYNNVRGAIAIPPSSTLRLDGDTAGQPCQSFALHDSLPYVKQLYDDKDLLFLANTGVLSEPVDQSNFKDKTLTSLFSHSDMRFEINRLDPRNEYRGTGALGRMADILEGKGFRTSRTAVESGPLNLAGLAVTPAPIFTLDERGVSLLNITDLSSAATQDVIGYLNGQDADGEKSGIFGEIWSTQLAQSLNQTEKSYYLLQKSVKTDTKFGDSGLDKRVKLISQLVKTRKERAVDRDFFFVDLGGFDHHSDVGNRLSEQLKIVNDAFESLVTELKTLGVWDDVVIVQTSDFARTLVPNSNLGSDHGWGGNYMMAGGAVKGRRIVGKYPELKLTSKDHSDNTRGRVIPTTSWDSVFKLVGRWMGVQVGDADEVNYLLPNQDKFKKTIVYGDLFTV